MTKKLLTATFYAAIAFSVTSYISVMISLLPSVGELRTKPVTNIGFPFKYYYQFWLNGSDSPNWGWDVGNFILDGFVIWGATVFVYWMIKRKS